MGFLQKSQNGLQMPSGLRKRNQARARVPWEGVCPVDVMGAKVAGYLPADVLRWKRTLRCSAMPLAVDVPWSAMPIPGI